MSAGGRSNAPGNRRISAFVTAFEPTERLSNSCGQKTTETLLKNDCRVRVEKLRLEPLIFEGNFKLGHYRLPTYLDRPHGSRYYEFNISIRWPPSHSKTFRLGDMSIR